MGKRLLLIVILLVASFSVRVLFWIFDFSHYVHWAVYDVQYYVDNSILLIKSLFSGNLEVVRHLLFHPLLGFYTTGVSSLVFSNFLDKYHAGLLSPIIFSSLMCVIVYLIGEKLGGFKMGFIAWFVATFDPYSIQFSTTFLDMPATFFSTLFFYLLLSRSYSDSTRRLLLLGVTAGFAISSKHIVVPTILLLLFLSVRRIRSIMIVLLSAVAVYLILNAVKFTSLEMINNMLHSNIQGGAIGIPAIIYGPIEIGKPYTYPWYILTYLGLGYTGIGVAPYITPVIVFILFCYHRFSKNNAFSTDRYSYLVQWTALSLIPLILLPRNYWIPLGRFPGMKVESDVLTKFFYPYYYVITIPSFSIFAGYLFSRIGVASTGESDYKINRILLGSFEFITIVFILLSPLALAANTVYPFWDFLFTLLINIEKNEPILKIMSIQSMIITISFLAIIILLTMILKCRK